MFVATPRSRCSSSNFVSPKTMSRRISGVHGSPSTARVRAIEQGMARKSVRCIPAA